MARRFDDKVEERLCLDFNAEYGQSKQNRQQDCDDFENWIDMFEQKRTAKEYQWLSDIKIPEYVSQELTQASMDAALCFKTRDFAEIYLEDTSDEAKDAASAARTLINRTLNRHDLFYYQKRIRAGTLARLSGEVHAECRWSKASQDVVVGHELVESDVDINDQPITDRTTQLPKLKPQPITKRQTDVDQFEIEIIDNRNIFYDSSYTYSLQRKPYVIVRSERSLEWMKRNAATEGYFNLDLLEEAAPPPDETETSQETYNKYRDYSPTPKSPLRMYDVLKRYGWAWCLVEERDQDGVPSKVKPGMDDEGKIKDKAELHELVQSYASTAGELTLVAYHPTPYIDCFNRPYRPLLRGLCYLHPTEDGGFGDAKHAHDLQIGLDDTINMSNDRTKLATMPVFTVNKYGAFEENRDEYYWEPGHFIPRINKDDLEELTVQDNIQGAMMQAEFFRQGMRQLTAMDQSVQGKMPAASTTATSIMATEQRSDTRSNFKALTWTHTWDAELYRQIMQMTWRFAEPETGFKLMGDKVYKFRPDLDYFFKPVTAAIESEQSKQVKLRNYTGLLQMFTPYMQLFANQPGFILFLDDIFQDIAECMGKEIERAAGKLLNPNIPPMNPKGGQEGQDQGGPGAQQHKMGMDALLLAPSNQQGIPQGVIQSQARMNAGGSYY